MDIIASLIWLTGLSAMIGGGMLEFMLTGKGIVLFGSCSLSFLAALSRRLLSSDSVSSFFY
jgi:hypothetical protein